MSDFASAANKIVDVCNHTICTTAGKLCPQFILMLF